MSAEKGTGQIIRKKLMNVCLLGLAVALVLITTVMAVAGFMDIDLAGDLLAFGGYYLVAAAALIASIFAWIHLEKVGFQPVEWLKYHQVELVVSGLVAVSILIAVKPGYRVLSDETNLLAVARSMTFDKNVYNTTMQIWTNEGFEDLENLLPTRPLLYPFLTSVVHTFSGYRVANGFYLNAFLAFLFLCLVCCSLRAPMGIYGALGVMMLAASQPVFALAATSGGFEMLNLLGLTTMIWIVYLYNDRPQLSLLVVAGYVGVLFCHIRYENPLFVALALPFVLRGGIDWRRIAPHVAVWSVLLLPRVWQAVTAHGHMENGDKDLLSFARVPQRMWDFAQGLVDPNLRYPYALSVTLIVGFMVLLAVVFYRDWRSWRPPTKAALSYGILCYAVYLVVTSSHFLADPLHPSVSRLFMLPAVFLTALAIPGALVVKGKYQFLFLMCGVTSLLFAQPISMDKKQTRTLTLIRLTESLYRFLDDYADARSVIVVDRPGQYTLRPISAVSPEWMNANVDRLVNGVKSGLYSKVLVVQEQRGDDPALVPSLDARFNLDPIHRFQNDSRTNYIISQLRAD